MASEDVIELGSSDDEPESARASASVSTSKKVKPPLNAMVHIPSKLPGITIKPRKKGVSSSATSIVHNPYANKNNSKSISNLKPVKVIKTYLPAHSAIQSKSNPKGSINPMCVINTMNNSQIKIKKVTKNMPILRSPVRPVNIPITTNPISQGQKCLTKLPPGITITRTNKQVKRKMCSVNVVPSSQLCKKSKLNVLSKVSKAGEVCTVELDDDNSNQTANPAPQWYIKPEKQTTLEEKNNKEPDNFIEITIEDSPIKAISNKHACEIEKQDTITIEDSPGKPTPNKHKPNDASGSDDDKCVKNKTPHSKKKLEYPKNVEHTNNSAAVLPAQIEIEIEPMKISEPAITTQTEHNTCVSSLKPKEAIIEIHESPLKKRKIMSVNLHTSPVKINQPDICNLKESNSLNVDEKDKFHPIYQDFINLCYKLEDSEDMKKIVEKKIKLYYTQVPKEYTESEEFIEMVSSKIELMKAGPDKMYLYIKDIVDELQLQRKIAKSQAAQNEKKELEAAAAFYGEEIEQDSKRKRQVRKLEKTLKKLHRAIQKLEDQEVDFDDDGDSVYILTERYKERLVRVHAKLCQLSNTKMPSEPRLRLEPRAGHPGGAARRLEKWINRRVPVGTPLPFPDFHDVLRCVREANQQDDLCWNEADIMEEARDLFTRCGKKLQRRRQENEWRLAVSRLSASVDPAEESHELKIKLEENRKISAQKESELINKFADKQKQMKLEAVEIGDKEADESPVESGDEAQEEAKYNDKSLENSEERKERLRRLLKERSKNSSQTVVYCDDSSQDQHIDDTDKVISSDTKKDAGVTINQQSEKVDENEATIGKKDENVEVVSERKEVETDTQEDKIAGVVQKSGSIESVLSLSDDSKQLDSDVDELHLLQKLHSGTDLATSTLESSDSDSPIAISDTLNSSDDALNKNSNVVSIENSSDSESETSKEQTNKEHCENQINQDGANESQDDAALNNDDNEDVDMLSDNDEPKNQNRNSNGEYSEPMENILLASTDDESNQDKRDECNVDSCDSNFNFNLNENSISISETIIQGKSCENSAPNSANTPSQDSSESTLHNVHVDDTEVVEKVIDTDSGDKVKDVIVTDNNVADPPGLKDKVNEMTENSKADCGNTESQPISKIKENESNQKDGISHNASTEELAHNSTITEEKDVSTETGPVSTVSIEAALEITTKLNVDNNECENSVEVNTSDCQSSNVEKLEHNLKLPLESELNSCEQTEAKEAVRETTTEV